MEKIVRAEVSQTTGNILLHSFALDINEDYLTNFSFSNFQVHRLVVVDEDDKVIGIISLSDLLFYLVLRPCGKNSKM